MPRRVAVMSAVSASASAGTYEDEEDADEEEIKAREDLEAVAILLLESGAKISRRYDWHGRLPLQSKVDEDDEVTQSTSSSAWLSSPAISSEDCFGWRRMWTVQTPRLIELLLANGRLKDEVGSSFIGLSASNGGGEASILPRLKT